MNARADVAAFSAVARRDAAEALSDPVWRVAGARSITDATIAAEETLRCEHPAEYEKRKAEAYVFGEGNPSPIVVTFTTELASMAANEMLNRMNGFRGAPIKNLVRKFHLMEDLKPGAKPRPGCALCDDTRYWGRGDVEPFLDRS